MGWLGGCLWGVLTPGPKPLAAAPQTPPTVREEADSPTWADACFQTFLQGPPGRDALLDLLQPLPADDPVAAGELLPANTRFGEGWRLQGGWRLRSLDFHTSFLLMSLERPEGFVLRCRNDAAEIALQWRSDVREQWRALARRREALEQPRLVACSENLADRLELRYGAPLSLGWRQGVLWLARGDVVVLRTELAEPPTEVILQGQAAVAGLAWRPCSDGPAESLLPPSDAPPAKARPLDAAWTATGDSRLRVRPADGAIELQADGLTGEAAAETHDEDWAPRWVTLRCSGLVSGCGVFWAARPEGSPTAELWVVQDPAAARLLLAGGPPDADAGGPADLADTVSLDDHVWLQVLAGGSCQNWRISSDGRRWFRVAPPKPLEAPVFGALGVRFAGRPAAPLQAAVQVRELSASRLPRISSLAVAELARQAPPLEAATWTEWVRLADASLPNGADPDAWRRSAAVKTLARGCNPALCGELLNFLWLRAQDLALAPEELFALLEEAATLVGDLSPGGPAPWLTPAYCRWAGQPAQPAAPSRLAREALLRSPAAGEAAWSAMETLLVNDLISMAFDQQWRDLLRMRDGFAVLRHPEPAELLNWFAAEAERRLPRDVLAERGVPLQPAAADAGWRLETDRDAYTRFAALHALQQSGRDDALREELQRMWPAPTGLVQSPRSDGHAVSLAAAAAVWSRQFAPASPAAAEENLAAVRLDASLANHDRDAVRWLTELHPTTRAAQRGRLWLAEQAWERGQIRQAAVWFGRAAEVAPGLLDQPPWSQRKSQLQASPPPLRGLLPGATVAPGRPPAGAESAPIPLLFGEQMGRLPLQDLDPRLQRNDVDWVARQTRVLASGEELWINNRFQTACWSLTPDAASLQWRSRPLGVRPPPPQFWPLHAMRVVLDGPRVLSRQLTTRGPTLACWDRQSGELLWSLADATSQVLTDPFRLGDSWWVATAAPWDNGPSQADLWRIDSRFGVLLQKRALGRAPESWLRRPVMEVVETADGALLQGGGSVLSLTPAGSVRWWREQWTLPAEADPRWGAQAAEPPLAVGSLVFCTQPGLRAVEALEAESGELRWRRVLPLVRRLIAADEHVLLVQTDEELLGLAASDGATRYHIPLKTLPGDARWLDGVCSDDRTAVALASSPDHPLAACQVELADGSSRWFEMAAATPETRPQCGPLVPLGDALWLVCGEGGVSAQRRLVRSAWRELAP